MIYHVLKFGTDYVDQGEAYYEERYRARLVSSLTRRAQALGYTLTKAPTAARTAPSAEG